MTEEGPIDWETKAKDLELEFEEYNSLPFFIFNNPMFFFETS